MFAAPPPASPQVVAPGTVAVWDLKRDGQGKTYRIGPYLLRVTAAKGPGAAEPQWAPRLEASPAASTDGEAPPFATLHLAGVEGFAQGAQLRLTAARLDPASRAVSVLITSFSGGAHCCDDVQVATPSAAAAVGPANAPGWSALHPGAFDGAQLGFGPNGSRLPAGADGTFGVSIPDDAFGYAFDCFACSFQPLRIYGLRAGALVERTAAPPFRSLLEADMRQAEGGCRAHNKGVCPGYLADAARLGLWTRAWKLVVASIPAQPQGGYPNQLCNGLRVEDKCRPGERAQVIPSYYAAVRLFLKWRGYPVTAGD